MTSGMSRKTAGMLFFAALLCALTIVFDGCGRKASESGPYLVLYAFEEEGTSIAEKMTITGTARHLGRRVIRGRVSGKEVVLAELGVGMGNAAMTTQRLIDHYRPQVVIVTGIAGSIDSAVSIGDIVVCERWIEHDYGYVGADGFQPGAISVALPDRDSLVRVTGFEVDDRLFSRAEAVAASGFTFGKIGERTPKLLTGGVGVSGNSFIDNVEKRLWLSGQFEAMITDMESAAVAQVCTVNGVPFIAFRSASDLAGGSGSETARAQLDQFFRIAADNSSMVVLQYLRAL